MISVVREKHKQLVDKCFSEEYYVGILDVLEGGFPSVETMTLDDISSFWNKFWWCLPDSRSIHRPPFNEICDMAEGSYLQQGEAA